MFTVTQHATIAAIPDWDDLERGSLIYGASWWLRDSEEIFAAIASPGYVVVRDGDTLVGGMACWTVHSTESLLPPLDPDRLFATWTLQDGQYVKHGGASSLPLAPYTLCAPPRGFGSHLHLQPALAAETRREVIALLWAGARSLARDAGSQLLWLPYLTSGDALDALSAVPDLVTTFGLTDCSFTSVSTFEAYLRAFRSHRRQRIVQDLKRFDGEGLTVEVHPLSHVLQRAPDLLGSGRAKHGWEAYDAVTRHELELAATRQDDRTRAFCAVRSGTIVGVAFALVDRGAYDLQMIGVDPDIDRRAALYFNLVYYATLRHAATDHVTQIHFGTSSLDAKYRRGCTLEPRWSLVEPLSSWSETAREDVRRGGASLLAVDRAILAGCISGGAVDDALGLASARALLPADFT